METTYFLPSSVFQHIEKYNSVLKTRDQNCKERKQLEEQSLENSRLNELDIQLKELDDELTKLTKDFTSMIQKILGEYCFSDTNAPIEFPSNLDTKWRKIIHDESDAQDLAHESKGKKNNRKLVVSRKGLAIKKQKGSEFEDCPDPIIKVSYSWIKNNQIRIEFPQPDENGSMIEAYHLYVYNEKELQFLKEMISKENAFTLQKLKPSILYIFQITAENSFGESDRKVTFKFMTPERFGGSAFLLGDNSNEIFNSSIFDYKSKGTSEEVPFVEEFIPLNEKVKGSCLSLSVDKTAIALLTNGKVLQWGMTLMEFSADDSEGSLEDVIPVVSEPFYLFSEESQANIIIKTIHCGEDFSIAIDIEGRVYSWGLNENGQLGLGDRKPRIMPTLVNFYDEKGEAKQTFIKEVAVGGRNVIALDDYGKVYVWGKMQAIYGKEEKDRFGQTTSFANFGIDQIKPRQVSEVLNYYKAKKIATGDCFNMIITEEGFLYSWGNNQQGQLGIGLDKIQVSNSTVPRRVEYFEKDHVVLDIACGKNHCLALVENKDSKVQSIFTWGNSKFGQAGYTDQEIKILPSLLNFFENKTIKEVKAGWRYSIVQIKNEKEETEVYVFGKVCDFKKFLYLKPTKFNIGNINSELIQCIKTEKKNIIVFAN